jgi:hypothetical protein
MVTIRFSEMAVLTKATRRKSAEDVVLKKLINFHSTKAISFHLFKEIAATVFAVELWMVYSRDRVEDTEVTLTLYS